MLHYLALLATLACNAVQSDAVQACIASCTLSLSAELRWTAMQC